MEKPYVVKKIDLSYKSADTRKVTEQLTKEEFINRGPGSQREINGEIYDLWQKVDSLETGKEKRTLLLQLSALIKKQDKPIADFDWNDTGYDISFSEEEPKYDRDGMRDDDEYNPKNWLGHDD